MDCNDVKPRFRVKTCSVLGGTAGMLIKQTYLDNRRPDTIGIVYGHVPGHGGDVWWVKHEAGTPDSQEAAYCFDEFEEYKE